MKYYVSSGVQYSLKRKLYAAVLTLVVSIGIPVAFAAWQGEPGAVIGPGPAEREPRQPSVTLDKPDEKEAGTETEKEPSTDNNVEKKTEKESEPDSKISSNTETEEPAQTPSPPPPDSRPVGGRGGGTLEVPPEETNLDNGEEDSSELSPDPASDTAAGK